MLPTRTPLFRPSSSRRPFDPHRCSEQPLLSAPGGHGGRIDQGHPPEAAEGHSDQGRCPERPKLIRDPSTGYDKRDSDGAIYELRYEDGAVLGRFELPDGRQGSEVACVHDGKFLSADFEDGKIIPLVGSAEP